MEPKRFLLEGPTLRGLQERVIAEHGSSATIIAAERITVGGIRGFFARQHFEVTVEVMGPAQRRESAHAGLDISARLGIAALLDDADEAESQLHSPQLSTASDGFARLMDELTFATGRIVVPDAQPEPAAALVRPPVPTPLTRPGDLVLIVGLEDDPLTIARLMLRVAGAGELRISGALQDRMERVDDRRGAVLARARGVEIGHSTFIAYGLEPASDAVARAATLTAIGADQVWVVVDASRKSEDTIRWVNMVVVSIGQVHAVAALGRQFTTSPATVDDLGLPVEWMDGRIAAAPTGRRAAPPHARPRDGER